MKRLFVLECPGALEAQEAKELHDWVLAKLHGAGIRNAEAIVLAGGTRLQEVGAPHQAEARPDRAARQIQQLKRLLREMGHASGKRPPEQAG